MVANDIAYILSVEGGRQFHTWYEQARRLVEDDGDLRSRASLLRTWASYCCSAGRFRDAMAAAQSCRPLAAEAGDRYTEADALLIAAQAGVRSGDPEPMGSLAREAAAIGTALRSVRIQTLARLATARVEVRRGRPDAGARALRQARSSISEHGIRVMHGDLAEAEAMLALDRGQWDRAGACAEDLRTALAAVPMRLWSAVPDLMAGRALLGAGRPDEALPLLRRAAEEGSRSDAAGAAALAAACAGQAAVLCGALDGHRRPAAPAARADDDGHVDPEVAAVTAETEGIAAMRRDDARAAVPALDDAVRHWESVGLTVWLARALSLRADALRATGDRTPAAASLNRARTVLDALRTPARERDRVEHPLGVDA